jgi:hypothetical protein
MDRDGSDRNYLREQDNVLIVKMKNHRNQSKNLAIAVKEYVPYALIPMARRYVEPHLMKAIDYVVSKEFLAKDTSALTYFINMNKLDLATKDHIVKVDKIHEQGFLTRILLSEYKKLGYLLYPKEPTSETFNETLELESKIYALVTKRPEEKVSPDVYGKFIKVTIVPIAKDETIEKWGIEPHLEFIKKSLEKGIRTFYVVAAGKINVSLAKNLVDIVERKIGLKKVLCEEYDAIFREQKIRVFLGMLEAS